MAKFIRCTDRYAHVELLIPRDLWVELEDRHLTQGETLRCVRVSALNAIRARLIEFAMQELEHRYGEDGLGHPAAAEDSGRPPSLQP